ncbi:MAG: argininosuccinate synthase [Vicinamibacteria bacterium]|nr:argininosuccinate synthase [Vicinamibacteria bacterium]
MNPAKKVVLAYSGDLDTSIVIPWIKENRGGPEVIAYCGDVGQGGDLEAVKRRALASGAARCIVEDLRETFVRDYCFKALQAGALYEGRHLPGGSLTRPLLAYGQAMCALAEGADALAHGAAPGGNNQIRFEVAYATFAPRLEVIAPFKEWNLRSREDALDYAAKRNVPVDQAKGDPSSRAGNLWDLSHEGGSLEDPWSAPAPEMFGLSVQPEDAPDQAEELTVAFDRGMPVSVDGRKLGPVALVEELNRRAAAHGVGRLDVVLDRLMGMKSRSVHEAPGGAVLYAAHRELESLCLDRQTIAVKNELAVRYAELVHDGLWFSTLRHALAAFVDFTQAEVTGEVRLRLFKGSVTAVGRRSPRSLYRQDLGASGGGMKFDHRDAEGFIRLFSLPERVRAITRDGRTR